MIGKPFVGETTLFVLKHMLVVGDFDDRQTIENVVSYMKTCFFRFLVLLIKNTQDAPQRVYNL